MPALIALRQRGVALTQPDGQQRRDPSPDPGQSTSSTSPQLDARQPALPPSRTLPFGIRLPATRLLPRQAHSTSAIPATYGALSAGPDPGTVVGITLGAVGGFLLLLWLIYTCLSFGQADNASSYGTASVVTRKSRKSRHHHHRSPRRETVEVRTSRGPVVVEEVVRPAERVERVERVETTRRSVSRGPRIVREEDDDEDEVVVIEEHSPPRRHRSRRSSERRESYSRR